MFKLAKKHLIQKKINYSLEFCYLNYFVKNVSFPDFFDSCFYLFFYTANNSIRIFKTFKI